MSKKLSKKYEVQVINIEEAVKKSKNNFIRNLPKPAINFIKRVIHEDDLNRLASKYKDLMGIDFVKALLFEEFKVKINFLGSQNYDPNKKYVYVANHPLGGIDAMAHLYLVHQRHGNVISPSNELFEYIPNLRPLILGVNVFKRNTKGKVQELNELFASDNQVMLFPAGEVSRLIGFQIRDPEWKKSFVTKAVQYKRDIIASYISGRNTALFYLIAKLRKLSGIKLYIETMLLPREMFHQYNYELNFVTLDPISWEEIKYSGKSHQWWTEEIYRRVYQAKNQLKNK